MVSSKLHTWLRLRYDDRKVVGSIDATVHKFSEIGSAPFCRSGGLACSALEGPGSVHERHVARGTLSARFAHGFDVGNDELHITESVDTVESKFVDFPFDCSGGV